MLLKRVLRFLLTLFSFFVRKVNIMSKCRKHIKCKRIFGKIVGTDVNGNYIILVKNKTYILYEKDSNIKKDKIIELYELPDGVLLSKLTPSLGLEYENSVSKKDYDNTFDDSFSNKITEKSLLIGGRIGISIALLELFVLLFTRYLNIASIVLMLTTSLLLCLMVSAYYNYIVQKKYSRLTPQEYFEKTGELIQEEIYQMCEYRLRRYYYQEENRNPTYISSKEKKH